LRAADDPQFLHALSQCDGVAWLELERRVQDDELVQIAGSVGESQFIAPARDRLARVRHNGRRINPLSHIGTVSSRIASQGAADGPWNPDERFEAGEPIANSHRDRLAEFRSATGGNFIAVGGDSGEGSAGQMDHQAGHTAIANQQIRTSAEHTDGSLLVATSLDQPGEFIDRRRLGKMLSGPAEPKPRERSERLVLTNTMFKAAEVRHEVRNPWEKGDV
jgi:hypothetical protein